MQSSITNKTNIAFFPFEKKYLKLSLYRIIYKWVLIRLAYELFNEMLTFAKRELDSQFLKEYIGIKHNLWPEVN